MVLVGIRQTNRRIRPCGNILGSAIHRMNKSRYKIYIIWKCGATEMIFNGVGEAMDWLQKQYDYEVQ